MKFALVILESNVSRESIATDREAHNAKLFGWMTDLGEKGILVGGEAFETEQTRPVTVRFSEDGESTTTEAPFADSEETLGGYFIIEVENRDEAVEIAKTLPTGETIEVRPII